MVNSPIFSLSYSLQHVNAIISLRAALTTIPKDMESVMIAKTTHWGISVTLAKRLPTEMQLYLKMIQTFTLVRSLFGQSELL